MAAVAAGAVLVLGMLLRLWLLVVLLLLLLLLMLADLTVGDGRYGRHALVVHACYIIRRAELADAAIPQSGWNCFQVIGGEARAHHITKAWTSPSSWL